MPVELSTKAHEKGTYNISHSFSDENGDAVVPNTITWSLCKPDGTIVNSRLDVAIGSPASSIDITLQGDDLAILNGKSEEKRVVVLEWTYNSSLGIDLPGKEAIYFQVVHVPKVG